MWSSVSVLFHLACIVFSMFIITVAWTELHSLLWLNNIPLSLSSDHLMDIWVVSTFQLLWIMSLWAFTCIWMHYFKKDVFIFRERGREREREGEKHHCVVASRAPPTGDLAHNPGMCPDWESNHDHLVHRPALNPLSYTSQGWMHYFLLKTSSSLKINIATTIISLLRGNVP